MPVINQAKNRAGLHAGRVKGNSGVKITSPASLRSVETKNSRSGLPGGHD